MANVTPDELRKHLAYEVHYLVLAAVGFPEVTGVHQGVYQDSALIHARNLLEFTNPRKSPRFGWWIADVGGQCPPADVEHEKWQRFINANVSHLGAERTQSREWPIPKDDQRLITLAQYVLRRVRTHSQGSTDCAAVMQSLAQFGLDYLDDPSESNLAKIANAIDQPL